jgi:hypothetical protein
MTFNPLLVGLEGGIQGFFISFAMNQWGFPSSSHYMAFITIILVVAFIVVSLEHKYGKLWITSLYETLMEIFKK